MRFYLGTDEPAWLERTSVPLFLSRRRLVRRSRLPRAVAGWALDSVGFTELQMHGRWTLEPRDYVAEVRRYAENVGGLLWASPQDWMCEPAVIHGGTVGRLTFRGTGLSVVEHQARTIRNYLELRSLAPDLPWIPVLQGYAPGDYLEHAEQYDRAGVDLASAGLVGVGSVCRRQSRSEAFDIFAALAGAGLGLRLHGFGLKKGFLGLGIVNLLASCDSMAWSFRARRSKPLDGCSHTKCSHCLRFALLWREEVLAQASRPSQNILAF
jgi:hypothetical protein